MKAIVQSYRGGRPEVREVPEPALEAGKILVRTRASLVSAGTERLMVELAQKSLLGKARSRPDLVKRVFSKLGRDGLAATVDTVRSRLDRPVTLGYSAAGTVIAAGEGVTGFVVGDRVACAGAGHAAHAEVISVPELLAVKLPDGVSFEDGAFATVGAIALHGLRLARTSLGETVAVVGLGLVGLLAAQLARAGGCRVAGMDPDAERCRLGRELGLEETAADAGGLEAAVRRLSAGAGADAVLVAAATPSSEPLELAARVARPRAAVVVVGAVGMEVPRQPYYDKELTLQVSRSYGPGRYDPEYEDKGRDYPLAYVRWTENRNLGAFVAELASGRVRTGPLVSHRFDVAHAGRAYEILTGERREPSLGMLLTYPLPPEEERRPPRRRLDLAPRAPAAAGERLRVGVVGAGQFASGVLMPALAEIEGVELAGVAAASGVNAEHAARKFGFRFASTGDEEILANDEIDAVVVATRHHLHARQVVAALTAGKSVFVEKPLCLTRGELAEIEAAWNERARAGAAPLLMVGYNRRFAPMARRLAEFLAPLDEPLLMHYRVNAGYLPAEHWTQDPEVGGGRIVGEVCHFVDFLSFLAGGEPRLACARALPDGGRYRRDNLVATFDLARGSVGTVTYAAGGDPGLAKERLEVLGGGAAAVLDNFRRLELARDGKRRLETQRLRQDKGHRAELEAFVAAARDGGEAPIPFAELVAVSSVTFDVLESLGGGEAGG